MRFDKFEYKVSDLPSNPQVLTIYKDGLVHYESFSNWGNLENPEIGIYEMKLANEDLGELVTMLTSPPFESLSDHWGNVLSGDRHQRMILTKNGVSHEKLLGSKEPIDINLLVLIDFLQKLIEEVMQFPKQTLHIQLGDLKQDKNDLIITTTLFNRGNEGVFVRHPFDLLTLENGSLIFQIWSKHAESKSTPKISIKQIRQQNLGQEELAPQKFLHILGGEEIALDIVAEVEAETGSYELRLQYSNLIDAVGDQALLIGEVVSKPISIVIP